MNAEWEWGQRSSLEASGRRRHRKLTQRLSALNPCLAGTPQPHRPGAPAGRVRSELRTKQQILKQRRQAQKRRFLQRGGLKQLSARNRRRAQELQQGAFGRAARSKKGKMRKSM